MPDDADQMATADGRAKTVAASRARLARMVGCDAGDAGEADWHALAQWFAERQLGVIVDAAMLVLSRAGLPPEAPFIGAGIGDAVVREVAPAVRARASHCAPAAALAVLAAAQCENRFVTPRV